MEFVPEAFHFETEEAIGIGSQTLVGRGNCFSVELSDGRYVNIVNFYLEDLEEVLKTINWPIKVSILGGKTAVINDERIADDLYRTRFCEVCCPMDLLPLPQRLRKARSIASGKTSFSKCEPISPGEEPMIIESTVIEAVTRKLTADWTYETAD